MSFLRNAMSVWKSLRSSVRAVPRGRKRPASVETLEVRALLAGEFTDLGAVGLIGVDFAAAAWGDYDNDSDLDVLVSGRDSTSTRIAKVVENNGDGTFSELDAGLTGVYDGAAAWGDYDNDGNLDILLTGLTSEGHSIARVYQNGGDGTFNDINAEVGGGGRSVAWGDSDNDGDLDVLISGGLHTGVYRNNGDSTFTDVEVELGGVIGASAAWGDSDNDGDLDILLSGENGAERLTRIYENTGGNTFAELDLGLTGVAYGSSTWGDYDNDGDLDIFVAGTTSPVLNSHVAIIYENQGDNTFVDLNAQLPGLTNCTAAWGDYDNDGDLDILHTGRDSDGVVVARLYETQLNGLFPATFSLVDAGLTGVTWGSASWGDFDSDGRLDLLMAGSGLTKVHRNNAATANTPPGAPLALPAQYLSTTSLKLSWAPDFDSPDAVDNETAYLGLSYNLFIGTMPGASDVFSTMANPSDGTRRLPARGPIQGFTYTLTNAVPGTTYYWSVQAIDTSFTGGAFSTPAAAPMPIFSDSGVSFEGVYRGATTWGDYDSDGDLDALVTGKGAILEATIYRNEGGGAFHSIPSELNGVTCPLIPSPFRE